MVAIPNTVPSIATGLSFNVPHTALKAVTAAMARIADHRSTLPVLARVLIRQVRSGISFTATDLNTTLTMTLPVDGDAGAILVEAKSLSDLVKGIDGGLVTLRQTAQGKALSVASAASETTLIGMSDRDFPKVPTTFPVEMPPFVKVDGDELAALLGSVTFAVCKDETRFHLNGVYLHMRGDNLCAVATDGHRLALSQARCGLRDLPTLGEGVIIPAKAAREIVKLLEASDGDCEIAFKGPHLFVRRGGNWGELTLAAKVIDAQFPPYEQVIPATNPRICTVERKPLIAALKRAKTMCQKTRGVKLSLASGKLTLTSDHPDKGESSESITARSEYVDDGGTFTVGANAGYLLDAIDAIDDRFVTMEVGAALDPIVVRGCGEACEHGPLESAYVSVTMPMRI